MTDRDALDAQFDALTPFEQLILETLASRFRLGHKIWTFNASPALTKTLSSLSRMGLVEPMSNVTPVTRRAALSPAGKEMLLLPDYTPPVMMCPTECDDDCDADCHEPHDIRSKWQHQPECCPAVIYARRMAEM